MDINQLIWESGIAYAEQFGVDCTWVGIQTYSKTVCNVAKNVAFQLNFCRKNYSVVQNVTNCSIMCDMDQHVKCRILSVII